MGKEVDLIQAVKAGDIATVQKLLHKTSSVNSKKVIGSGKQSSLKQQDADGLSVLHHAAITGNHPLMKLLLENGAKVDEKDNKGLRPLHYAAWLGKDVPVELLLHCGSCVNESAHDGITPLHMACEHGHTEVVKKLLAHKGDPSRRNNQHKTPLDLACEFGRKQVVELLLASENSAHLQLESETDILDNSRTTCLHLAARNGHADVIKLLIEFGFNVNQQTSQGTCLHEAAKYGKTEVVRLLLSNGIDVSRLNSYEETALEIVNKFTATRAAKELKQILREASSELLARAVRNYSKPLDASHLAFKEGDIIMVVDHFSKNNLWKGYCASSGSHVTHVGYFPSDAVVIIDPNNANRDSGFSTNNSCIGHSFNSAEGTDGQQNRLSGQSSESGVSGVSSYQPSSHSPVSCSHDSLEYLDDSSYSSSSLKTHEPPDSTDSSDLDLLRTLLRNLHLDEYVQMFVNAGYDLQTISRMTPEDLTAIGITQPSVRKKLMSEISRLTIPNGIPDFRPRTLKDWLNILHLSEYCDLLSQQGYDIDSITGIMWEDLEEIGIQKLGHQKKIMLAIDRLKKIASALHPAPSSGETPAPPGITHLSAGLSSVPFITNQFCSGNVNMLPGRPYFPSHDMKMCLSKNTSEQKSNPLPSAMAAVPNCSGINHSSHILAGCRACSSFQKKICDNFPSSDVIGPAPPLPVRSTIDSGTTYKAKQGTCSSSKEIKNVANLSHLHNDWYPDANVSKMYSDTQSTSCDYGPYGKSHHFSSYGTLPRRPLHKSHATSTFKSKLVVGNEPNSIPFETERLTNDSFLAPKCLNKIKIDARPYRIAEEMQPLCFASSFPKFQYLSERHRLDAFNLEDGYSIYSDRNYGKIGFNNRTDPERGFLSTSTNETGTTNYSIQSYVKETSKNCHAASDGEEKCSEQSSHLSNDSSLVCCQNLSSVSLNSSDSSGTFDGSTLPFANEDYGTIKERSAQASASDTMVEPYSNDHKRDGKVDGSTHVTSKDNEMNDAKERISSDAASAIHQNSASNQADEGVFDDIDGMLFGLTQELDEMLKLQV